MKRLFFAGLRNECFHFMRYANNTRRSGRKLSSFRRDGKKPDLNGTRATKYCLSAEEEEIRTQSNFIFTVRADKKTDWR